MHNFTRFSFFFFLRPHFNIYTTKNKQQACQAGTVKRINKNWKGLLASYSWGASQACRWEADGKWQSNKLPGTQKHPPSALPRRTRMPSLVPLSSVNLRNFRWVASRSDTSGGSLAAAIAPPSLRPRCTARMRPGVRCGPVISGPPPPCVAHVTTPRSALAGSRKTLMWWTWISRLVSLATVSGADGHPAICLTVLGLGHLSPTHKGLRPSWPGEWFRLGYKIVRTDPLRIRRNYSLVSQLSHRRRFVLTGDLFQPGTVPQEILIEDLPLLSFPPRRPRSSGAICPQPWFMIRTQSEYLKSVLFRNLKFVVPREWASPALCFFLGRLHTTASQIVSLEIV